ncbi:MAG: hypothetical protein KGY99_03660 [Phycisphaerae bacterium]|nr:hypothetical protein [Phycisphaerae bacterium]
MGIETGKYYCPRCQRDRVFVRETHGCLADVLLLIVTGGWWLVVMLLRTDSSWCCTACGGRPARGLRREAELRVQARADQAKRRRKAARQAQAPARRAKRRVKMRCAGGRFIEALAAERAWAWAMLVGVALVVIVAVVLLIEGF